MEAKQIVLNSEVTEEQRRYIQNFRNWMEANNKFFGEKIVYSGDFIPEYEAINKKVSEKISEEHKRLNRLCGIAEGDGILF